MFVLQENAKASIFTADEELFAVGRTVSRLLEMQREEYWDQASKSWQYSLWIRELLPPELRLVENTILTFDYTSHLWLHEPFLEYLSDCPSFSFAN